jgi:exodeoxyribonuclease-3
MPCGLIFLDETFIQLDSRMKIATYNINVVNDRLPILLKWLGEAKPDVVCLQELKAPQDKFPERALLDAGYNAIWHGQKMWNCVAILSKDLPLQEVRNSLPGDEEDLHNRYIEAIVGKMLVCCLYLPNGNPAPGPKFDYKMAWFKRLKNTRNICYRRKYPLC